MQSVFLCGLNMPLPMAVAAAAGAEYTLCFFYYQMASAQTIRMGNHVTFMTSGRHD